MGSHLDALRVNIIKMEDYRVANEDTSQEVMEKNENTEVQKSNEKVMVQQSSKDEKPAEKPKKKVKKVNVKVTDHDETDKAQNQDQENHEMGGMGDTLFILDLMRQRKEKLMR